MMPGMPAFWASNPERSHGVVHARAPEAPARKPARKGKRNKTPQIAVFCGWGRVRARALAPEASNTNGEKANGQNNSPTLSIAFFDGMCGVL